MGLREGGPKWVGPFYPFASWLMTHSQWPRSSHGHSAAPADLVPSIIYIGNVLLRVSPCVSTIILLGPLLYWRLWCHAGLCSIFHQSNDCCIWKYNRIKLNSEYSESLNEQLTFCITQAISFDIYWRKKISGVEEKTWETGECDPSSWDAPQSAGYFRTRNTHQHSVWEFINIPQEGVCIYGGHVIPNPHRVCVLWDLGQHYIPICYRVKGITRVSTEFFEKEDKEVLFSEVYFYLPRKYEFDEHFISIFAT